MTDSPKLPDEVHLKIPFQEGALYEIVHAQVSGAVKYLRADLVTEREKMAYDMNHDGSLILWSDRHKDAVEEWLLCEKLLKAAHERERLLVEALGIVAAKIQGQYMETPNETNEGQMIAAGKFEEALAAHTEQEGK